MCSGDDEKPRLPAGMGPRYKQRILQELASADHVYILEKLPPELQDKAAQLQAKGAALRAAVAAFRASSPSLGMTSNTESENAAQKARAAGGAPQDETPTGGIDPKQTPFSFNHHSMDTVSPFQTAAAGKSGGVGGGQGHKDPGNADQGNAAAGNDKALVVVNNNRSNSLQLSLLPDVNTKRQIVHVPEYMQQRIGQVLQSVTQKDLELALRPKPQRLPSISADADIDKATCNLKTIIAKSQAWDRQHMAKQRAETAQRNKKRKGKQGDDEPVDALVSRGSIFMYVCSVNGLPATQLIR